MSKRILTKDRLRFPGAGKGLCIALCTASIAALTGVLATRHTRRNPEQEKKAAPKEELPRIHKNLLCAISQDLRTPLSSIMGNSLLYLENHESLEEAEKLRLVSRIYEASGYLAGIAENLLAIAHIQDPGQDSGVREEMVEEVLGEALQKLEKRHPGCRVNATVPRDAILLPMDALLIEQVLLNLLENALLHSGSREPVDVIVEDGAEEATFLIRDYGNGIPEDRLKNLLDSASPATFQKTGVGLPICKAILAAHHGTLTARNHACGAEFLFTLPKRRQ